MPGHYLGGLGGALHGGLDHDARGQDLLQQARQDPGARFGRRIRHSIRSDDEPGKTWEQASTTRRALLYMGGPSRAFTTTHTQQ